MNSELATNDIRRAIDEAIMRHHSPHPKGATHIDRFGNYWKYDERWYALSPFDFAWRAGVVIDNEVIDVLGLREL
jgi:hypothetical protein